MSQITITFPDSSQKSFEDGVTVAEVAGSIGKRLADAALVAKLNGQLVDLSCKIEKDTRLTILTDRDAEALEVYRHSSAHLLALAVIELFPGTQLGIGPPVENGFYYDFYRKEPFTPEDLEKIEQQDARTHPAGPALPTLHDPQTRRIGMVSERWVSLKCELIEEKASDSLFLL